MNTPMEQNVPLISATGVCLHRGGTTILDQVDIRVRDGEIITIIGPNGAGKTSLLRLLLGLTKPSSGKVFSRKGLQIGYLPQQLSVDPILPLSVIRFLSLSRVRSRQALATVAGETGIAGLLHAQLQSLSGGEWQRALLARALLANPDLLVLDEPTSNIDFAGQMAFYELLAELRRKRGCGILMVSHDLHMVMGATDTVICLDRHVCCSGAAETIAHHPEYARLFGFRTAATLAVYPHHHPAGHERHHFSSEGGTSTPP